MRLILLIKAIIAVIAMVFFVCLYANERKLISLSFHQVPTSAIVQALAEQQQLNLIFNVDEAGDLLQTVKLTTIDWQKALAVVTQQAKLQYTIADNILTVSPQPNPESVLAKHRQQQLDQQSALPLTYSTLKIVHADMQLLRSLLLEHNVLSERGKLVTDERTHSLVIHDTKPTVDNIAALVTQLDKPVAQVHIAARIVTMSSESLSELGIKWGYSGVSSQLVDHVDINLGLASPAATLGFNIAKRSNKLLDLELSALEAENQLQIIASPTLLTSHQHTASIKQGTEIPYEVSSGSNGATAIEFKQAVLGLEVTPRVLSDNQLELVLYITQNTAGRSIKRSDGGEALAIDTQEIRTQVRVNDGETLVLGGIFQQSHHQDTRAVPGIHKLPLIGNLFKYQSSKQQRRELIIFITPQLIPV